MQFDFELFLVIAAFVTGIIALIDIIFYAKQRPDKNVMPKLIEFSYSFFPVLLIVLLLRSFLLEPYRIPTGSLEPTLIPGDFIAANKFAYGLRLPVSHTKIFQIGEPKVGDITVFRFPVHPKIDFIKRIVGASGDKISYQNKVLYINNIKQPQKDLGPATDYDDEGNPIAVEKYQEVINGITHDIYENPSIAPVDFTVTVPKGEYFAMGDNRDNSYDSRYWGFVPEANLIGKAIIIWFSWDKNTYSVRWHRLGTILNKNPIS